MSSISTIGNATLIAYDEAAPILSTDPWFGDEDHAYFGSWTLSHEIPAKYKKDILHSKYIWFSHGHPDHLNPLSIKRLEGKNLLLPDHIGSRIYRDLTKQKN
jgi:L-ascorbate metabolism protein UlaG (beta-lactamase superfamily)